MDPRRRRLVWIAVVVLGVALILDGVLTMVTSAAYGGRTYGLAREGQTVPVWFGEPPVPPGYAQLLPQPTQRFGLSGRYVLPDDSTVECRFIITWVLCDGGWTLIYDS